MTSDRLFRASQEATFAHASIRRRVEAARAALTALQKRDNRPPLAGFAIVACMVEAIEHAEQIARLVLAASASVASDSGARYDTASAGQCITGVALRCAELAAFAERFAEGVYDPPAAASANPFEEGIAILVKERAAQAVEVAIDHASSRRALADLTREGEAFARIDAAIADAEGSFAARSERARARGCDRCGQPIKLPALAVRTVDGLRHDVCPEEGGSK